MSVVLFTDSQKLISERMKDDNDGEDHNRERIKEQLVFVAPKVNLTWPQEHLCCREPENRPDYPLTDVLSKSFLRNAT